MQNQNSFEIFEEYYSKTPFRKVLWNQLEEKEIYKTLKKLGVPENFKIVSLGCGTGQKEIYAANKGYKNIVGVDISRAAIEKAKLLAQEVGTTIKFHAENILTLGQSEILKNIQEPDLVLDWMSFHSVEEKYRRQYVETIEAINPKWILVRTFSKKDSDYLRTKKSKLPLGIEGMYKRFFDISDLKKLFSKFIPIINFDTKEIIDPKRFIDNKAAAKITVLFLGKKRIFS